MLGEIIHRVHLQGSDVWQGAVHGVWREGCRKPAVVKSRQDAQGAGAVVWSRK
jgi:hypothetical protein